MPKKVKFYFFHVQLPDDISDLAGTLDRAYDGRPDYEFERMGQAYRIETYRQLPDNKRVGTVTKISYEAGALRARRKERGIHEIPFDQDEGPASETAFLYAPDTNVMVLQNNYFGIRSGSLIRLLEGLTGISFDLHHIADRTRVLEKFNRMRIIRKVELAIAAGLEEGIEGVAQLARIARDFDARTLRIDLGVGPGRGMMNEGYVKRVLTRLLSRPDAVTRIRVTGKDFEDQRTEPIDLLDALLTKEIEVFESGRVIPAETLLKIIRQAYDEAERDGAFRGLPNF